MSSEQEQNRKSWNHATRAHNSHKGDQAAFLRGGGHTLFPEEIELLGEVRGQSLVHLQCNAGQDTLSLASQLGARVLGVDISDEAIDFATKLAADSGISGRFVRSDVFEWLESTSEQFGVAFASYGALPWIADIQRWARGVSRVLAPGGRLVVLEFHPILNLFDDDGVCGKGPGVGGGGRRIDWATGIGDYVAASDGALSPSGHSAGPTFVNPEAAHEWEWSIAEIVDAIARAGLVIERVREWPYSNGCKFFPNMVADGKRWRLAEGSPAVPLMYSIVASKK